MAETRAEQQLRAGGGRLVTGGRLALLAVAVLLLVAFVGLGSGRPLWEVGGPSQVVSPRSYVGDLVVFGFTLLAVASIVVAVLDRRRRRRKRAEDEPDDPAVAPVEVAWWAHPLVVLALIATVLAALLIVSLLPRGGADAPRQAGQQPAPPASGADPSAAAEGGLPPVHWWGLAVLALVLIAGTAAAWRLRSRRGQPDEPEGSDELIAAVGLSLEDVEAEPDPRRAVIRAYARMDAALGAYGLARRPVETPLEYLARALTSLQVGRRSVERLTVLHERAKFSQHDVDVSMKSEALAGLTALRDELVEVA
jgi:membrane protein implicated in regulation of membrane protease activity